MKKLLKGISQGLTGIDFVEIFDTNGDNKVSRKEFFGASADKWIRFGVSLGTSIISILYFAK